MFFFELFISKDFEELDDVYCIVKYWPEFGFFVNEEN